MNESTRPYPQRRSQCGECLAEILYEEDAEKTMCQVCGTVNARAAA